MKKVFAATVMAVVLASSASLALASNRMVQGGVSSVSPDGKNVTLVGGQTFTAAPNLSIEPIHRGDRLTLIYENGKDGQKEMTAFWIDRGATGTQG